jgi:hypothetical protein
LILASVFFILPLVPFVLKSSFENGKIFLFQGSNNFPDFRKYLNNYTQDINIDSTTLKLIDNASMETGAYTGDGSLKSKFLSGFIATTNSNVQGNAVDIGFLFLAFIPLIILIYFPLKKKYPHNIFFFNQLLIIFFTTYLLWLWKGKAIIWYGMTMFPLMTILFLEITNHISRLKILRFVVSVTIICWLILVFAKTETPVLGEGDQNNLTIIPPNIEYLKGDATKENFLEYYHPGKIDEIKILNSPEYRQSKIYLIDPFALFYIKENDIRCFSDFYLLTFASLKNENSISETVKRLKENDFELIAYNHYSVNDFSHSSELKNLEKELRNYLRENPDKIEVLMDDQLNGIVVGRIL